MCAHSAAFEAFCYSQDRPLTTVEGVVRALFEGPGRARRIAGLWLG